MKIGNDRAIEMSQLGRSNNSTSRGECPEIQITVAAMETKNNEMCTENIK